MELDGSSQVVKLEVGETSYEVLIQRLWRVLSSTSEGLYRNGRLRFR